MQDDYPHAICTSSALRALALIGMVKGRCESRLRGARPGETRLFFFFATIFCGDLFKNNALHMFFHLIDIEIAALCGTLRRFCGGIAAVLRRFAADGRRFCGG
ncbi:MAG: hypothetical protein FJX47_13870 [Alphaproteobacteria bacterium]|nr:hypothetical protein [Alphaproteobacteria bacterium]